MQADRLRHLEGLRPAVKREWETLLRREETTSPLASPDALVHLMDETFGQLIAGLKVPDRMWPSRPASGGDSFRGLCTCTLNPLLAYFATGDSALRAIAGGTMEEDLDEILLLFHAVAQWEIQSLCQVCQSRGEACCTLAESGSPSPFRP